MKTYFKINKSLVAAFFVSTLFIAYPFSNNAFAAQTENKSSIDYTPMYENPKYANKSLDPSANSSNQDKTNQKPLQAPPPDNTNLENQIPVSSSILPMLAMALGLAMWKLHFQLKKAKK